MSNSGQNTGSKKQNLIIVVLALLVVIAVGVIIFLVTKEDETVIKEDPSGGRGTVITQDNVDEALKDNSETVQDGYYTTSMSIDWHFDGKVSKDAYVANDTSNTRTVYFDLFLRDTKELIYSSPYIPLGAELKGVTLDRELEPGTYQTLLVYHLVDDEKNEVSTLSIGLTIYVK